ncbi:MAG: YraN family protein [Clostridiales bacterium]|nr:YraN family protein [Clostridiales bacterium]
MNKRVVGNAKETEAIHYLTKLGFTILERNFYTRAGEIDIVAKDGDYLAFVEVKYRWNLRCGFPSEAVTKRKQRKIVQCARYYLLTHGYGEETPCRFDVVVFVGEKIDLIKNAYETR